MTAVEKEIEALKQIAKFHTTAEIKPAASVKVGYYICVKSGQGVSAGQKWRAFFDRRSLQVFYDESTYYGLYKAYAAPEEFMWEFAEGRYFTATIVVRPSSTYTKVALNNMPERMIDAELIINAVKEYGVKR